MSDYRQPEVRAGSTVQISSTPEFTDPITAQVVKVNCNSIDVMVWRENGGTYMRNVWHRSDPKVRQHADLIRDDKNRAVWDETDDQKIIRRILQQIASLSERLMRLEARQSAMEENTAAPEQKRTRQPRVVEYGSALRSS